ncbi:phosphodiester glycosidase family protein [Pyxidicoccus xibeiensis]|uniref:phosphodiester glycosidase family protein n=1 Tax=Pyxidicoccus xibeiensis TaxID=2906759 RepID=UPI0020A74FB5|nr:phosphodiester glycosidase family protein [Pyxidicoccus xibeiensis]MCP3140241.1 phosphodiester glycosidase family protein [Pyxidicoccus xibeiensis]
MCRLLALLVCLSLPALAASPWEPLAPGLELAEFDAHLKSPVGDSRVTVVRVDVSLRPVRLLSAAVEGHAPAPTAEQWAALHGLLAVTNAGMFHPGGGPVGQARSEGRELNPTRRKDYRTFLVLHPRDKDKGLPPVALLDGDCDDVAALLPRYATVLQSIRMVDCKGRNTWKPQPRQWSTAALGIDGEGRLLLVHARSPYRTHDFIQVVRRLPLGVSRMMYLEGGPEASLHVAAPGRTVRRVGSYETGFNENDFNTDYWALPNVLGVLGPTP